MSSSQIIETWDTNSMKERPDDSNILPELHQHQEPQPQTSKLARYRDDFREYAGEFLGTAVLIIFGAGVNCQVALSSFSGVSASQSGNFLSVATGWAIGIAVGVWISGGGHINPAITMSMATWRGFPLRKVPGYIGAQLFGAWAGAAAVYGNYFHAIDIVEGAKGVRTLKTAGLFGTYALDYMTPASCFFSEFLATTILLLGLLAITDKRNKVPSGIVPIALFFVILGIASSLGMETGFALNPARDFGPRLLTSMVGYGGAVYTFRSQYWLWCPILAPILGAQFGTFLYDVLLVAGNDSVVDRFFNPHKPTVFGQKRSPKSSTSPETIV